MKYIIVILFAATSNMCLSQYKVIVEANPSNHGEVSSAWVNNYVVRVIIDNSTSMLIRNQQTWQSLTGDYRVSYFQKIVFKYKEEAIAFAKQFKNKTYFYKYDRSQLMKHNELSRFYTAKYKKIEEVKVGNEKPSPIVVISN